jgi:hypothetical protein
VDDQSRFWNYDPMTMKATLELSRDAENQDSFLDQWNYETPVRTFTTLNVLKGLMVVHLDTYRDGVVTEVFSIPTRTPGYGMRMWHDTSWSEENQRLTITTSLLKERNGWYASKENNGARFQD